MKQPLRLKRIRLYLRRYICRPMERNLTGKLALGVASVSLASQSYTLVHEIIPTDKMAVYFRFSQSAEIGTGQINMSFIFSNAGFVPHLIENLGIIIISTNTISPSSNYELSMCQYRNLEPPGFIESEPKEVKTRPAQYENGMLSQFFTPKSVFINGMQSSSSSVIVSGQGQGIVSALFDTAINDWNKYNTIVVCPTIRYFDAEGRSITAICRGWQKSVFRQGGSTAAPALLFASVSLIPSPEAPLCSSAE